MTFGRGTGIYFTASTDQGESWKEPVTVADVGALALGRHRGPRVAILNHVIVISAVVGERKESDPRAHGLPEAGNLVAWRSLDGGKTWVRAGVINDVPGAAREGLHAMAAAPDGSLFAAWLDLRAKGTKLYGSKSADGGVTWSKNVEIYSSPDGTICQCCHPALSIDPSGIHLMWRNALAGSRDLYVTSSTDGVHFAPASKLGTGTWKLDACPMDGGGLVMEGGKAISAWRRETDVYLAEGATEQRVGPGKDVALARSTKHETYLAWTKDGGIVALTPRSTEPVLIAKEGGFAMLVALANGGVLAAWETSSGIETKRLDQ